MPETDGLAQKMGESVGRGKILFGTLPTNCQKLILINILLAILLCPFRLNQTETGENLNEKLVDKIFNCPFLKI